VVTEGLSNVVGVNRGSDETNRSPSPVDHSLNVVITGIAENRQPSKWRGNVDKVLALVAGRNVEIGDAFRLGR